MRWSSAVLLTVSLLASTSLASRGRRDAAEDKKEDKNDKKDKKDLSPAETRVGPILPYASYDAYEPGLGYGVDGYASGLPLAQGGLGLGHGAIGHPGLLVKPYGHGLGDGYAYGGGYMRDGGIGNHGSEYMRGGNDGRYADGSFHQGGRLIDGGYQGLEGYKDNKHHIADDHANKAYYNNAHGIRKDLGNGEVYDKNNGFSQNSYNTLGDNELAGHNKGHHKTGFKKSYHKDESGNDESFYDVDHDEGNHEAGKKYGDAYGTNYATRLNGAHKINEFDANHLGREGYEGNGKLVALNQGLKDYYGRSGYYNNGNKYGSLGHGQSADFGNYGVGHGYQDGFNNGRNLGYSKYGRDGYYAPY